MILSKGFVTGLLTGAVAGGIMGMCIDPLKDKDSRRLRKSAGKIIHSMENMAENMHS
ncbi:MAG: YtxH domain-containing protein [Clostridia bacterium]|nr:YtxH domain-containing protein [Clostridia bacterium]